MFGHFILDLIADGTATKELSKRVTFCSLAKFPMKEGYPFIKFSLAKDCPLFCLTPRYC